MAGLVPAFHVSLERVTEQQTWMPDMDQISPTLTFRQRYPLKSVMVG